MKSTAPIPPVDPVSPPATYPRQFNGATWLLLCAALEALIAANYLLARFL